MTRRLQDRAQRSQLWRIAGARRKDIALQFLVETVLLSSVGGILGVCLGIGLSHSVTRFFSFQTIIRPWSPILAFAVSVAVGLIFGMFPAIKAARLDPIDALRHE